GRRGRHDRRPGAGQAGRRRRSQRRPGPEGVIMPDARSPDPVAAKAGPEGVIIPDARGAASAQAPEPAPAEPGPAPVVAVVGRPNVGKSTLVNRILGRRQAVVEDIPGVTRDRVAYDAQWAGRRFTVVDTGGWEPDAKDRAARIAAQAEAATETADAVLFVVDATVGATDTDEAAVKMLRRSGKPVLLVA